MKARSLLVLTVLIVAAAALPALAQKARAASVTHLPFWTAKGRPTRQFVPGLTAALLLTPEQQVQLAQAWQETMGSEAVANASRLLKRDPGATAAQKAAAQAVRDAAATALQLRINGILTMDQRALIEWINSVYAAARRAVAVEMEPEYAAAKGDKAATGQLQERARDRLQVILLQKLREILTPEQWTAMMEAAEAERRASESKGRGKSPEIQLKAPSPEAGKKNGAETRLKAPAPGS